MTDNELIEQWRDGEKRQRELWREILSRGLYFESQGIDPGKRDNAWRNPQGATLNSVKQFSNGVHGVPRSYNASVRYRKNAITMSEQELSEFE